MPKTYPITGIRPAANERGPLPTRQEITAWYNEPANKYQVSLFMRASRRLMETPIEE